MSDRDFSAVEAALWPAEGNVARDVVRFSFLENRISRVEEFIHSVLLP